MQDLSMGDAMSATAPTDSLSPADRAAHAAASYVRRTAVVEQLVLPPLPTQPAARRRAIQQRGW